MAEASYRSAVQAGGKNQKSLTVGWEVLGLERAVAERIFNEEAKEGFVTAREAMYGLQTQKYDKKGRRIDKEGKLENPEEANEDEDGKNDDGPISNVYECSECGYTLFVAQGRESKFFGQDFKCPECGAPKDKFKAREDLDE
jgi:rubrerythrin